MNRDVLFRAQPERLSRYLSKTMQHDLSDFTNRIALAWLIRRGDFQLITCAADLGTGRDDVKRLPPVVFGKES